MVEVKKARKQRIYTDELSREVFDLFDQKLYPADVSNLIGGSKKDYEHMYQYWIGQKREVVEEGLLVDFVLNISGYPEHIVGGKIIKVYTNSVMVKVVDSSHKQMLEDNLQGKVIVSIKDILKRY